MCELITFASTLSSAAAPDASTEDFRANPFVVRRFVNCGSGHSYAPHLTSFSIMCGACSCGLFVPRSWADPAHEADERRVKSLRARGWSAAKLERALLDHASAAARRPRRVPGFQASVLHYLTSVLHASGYIDFIVHTHRAGFNDEPFGVTGPVRLKRLEFESGRSALDLDTRYVIGVRPAAV
ncbi:hypothetical protein EG835_14065 [bacterium]|nr:hypothetical protein [bacterium]